MCLTDRVPTPCLKQGHEKAGVVCYFLREKLFYVDSKVIFELGSLASFHVLQ